MLELRYLNKKDGTKILQYRDYRCDETGRDLSTPWQEPYAEESELLPCAFVLNSTERGYVSSIQNGLGGNIINYTDSIEDATGYETEHDARLVIERNELSLWDYTIERTEG